MDEIVAFVISTRKTNEEYILSTITSEGRLIITSKEYFKPGSYVKVTGTKVIKDVPEIFAEKIERLEIKKEKKKRKEKKETKKEKEKIKTKKTKAKEAKEIKKINDFIVRNSKVPDINTVKIFEDTIMERLGKIFEKVAAKIKEAIFLNRPIIVRYHNDTDGVCSGLAFYFVMGNIRNTKFFVNKYPAYRIIECQSDIDSISKLDAEYLNPLLVICDFGSNEESIEAYRKVKEAGFEIIVIDHHPPAKKIENFVDIIISPHLVGGSSDYTAGLLASQIAYMLSQIDLRDLPIISLVGDRSKLKVEVSDKHEMYSTALDYLIASSKYPNDISEIAKDFLDKEFISMIYAQATEKKEEVTKRLLQKVKKKEFNGIVVFIISTDGEFVEGEYPGRGEMTSFVSDVLTKNLDKPAIIIGYGKRSFNLRLNTKAIDEGISCAALVKAVKKEIPNAIEAGGGHVGAAGIRVNKNFANVVLNQLLKEIEKLSEKKIK